MNKEEIKIQPKLSPFFFENKLYEFSQKKLNELDRAAMKNMTATSPEAKYKIGMVLLSLEYLEKFDEVRMSVDKDEMLLAAKRREFFSKIFNFMFFLILTTIFFVSGYVFFETYYKGMFF